MVETVAEQLILEQQREIRAELGEHRAIHARIAEAISENSRATTGLSVQVTHLRETLERNAQVEGRVQKLEGQMVDRRVFEARVYTVAALIGAVSGWGSSLL